MIRAISNSGCKNAVKSKCAVARLFSSGKEKLVVNSHNEFDPLEEVIVGRVEGSTIPEWHVSGKAVWPSKWWDMYKTQAGQPFPADLTKNGQFTP